MTKLTDINDEAIAQMMAKIADLRAQLATAQATEARLRSERDDLARVCRVVYSGVSNGRFTDRGGWGSMLKNVLSNVESSESAARAALADAPAADVLTRMRKALEEAHVALDSDSAGTRLEARSVVGVALADAPDADALAGLGAEDLETLASACEEAADWSKDDPESADWHDRYAAMRDRLDLIGGGR